MRMAMLKKNQVVIIVIALMLITAGYLNYTYSPESVIQTASRTNENFGDATLVSTNNVIVNDTALLGVEDTNQENTQNNEEKVQSSSQNTQDPNVQNSESTQNLQSQSVSSSIASAEGSQTQNTNDYFITAKMERDNMYSQQLENYEKINENANSTNEQKQIATEEMKRLNNEKSKIMIVENLIKIKGFEDVIVLINDKSVNVVVKAESLEAQSVSQIQNIISREIGTEIEDIHIMSKK